MRRLGIFVVHRKWWVIAVAVVAFPIAVLYGGGVHSKLSSGGFDDPASDSSRAAAVVSRVFPAAGQSDFVIVVNAGTQSVNDAAVQAEGESLTKALRNSPGIVSASSYWNLGRVPQLRSRDSHEALIFAAMRGTDDEKLKIAGELSPRFSGMHGPVTTLVTGRPEVTRQLADQAEKDLQRADLMTGPLTFIALVFVFGGVIAAALPLVVGLLAVLGAFVILTVLTKFTHVSVFSLNLTTALGLGLSIDYSLFIVSRYREELRKGVSPPVAVGRSMQTAGKTVAFSAGTVAISLAMLAIFPMSYLRSFAYAGVAVVALAAFTSIIVLPAILAALGPRVDKWRIFQVKDAPEGGFWRRQAERVMRHPVVYAVAVSTVLLVVAIPFFRFNPGLSDDRVGPKSMSSRVATQEIRDNFTSREADALTVLLPNSDSVRDRAKIDAYAKRLAAIPGVARVDAVSGYYLVVNGKVLPVPPNDFSKRFLPPAGNRGALLSVVPDVEPLSDRGEQLVRDLRAAPAPSRAEVAGPSAELVDTKAAVISRIPVALGLIAIATFILLFMMTGSLLVPLKALALNMLSLTATFGALVWLFQEGHLSGPLGFTATGSVDIFTPILMFCIAFGLSMDYEVFLISRIKEEYDLDRDNEHAVAVGIQKTGRIVTAAALLLTLVFVGIGTSQVTLVKAVGVGLSIAVLVDAFLIRATLVPAFMKLAGRLNWWSPPSIRRWHLRYGIWENEPIALLDREFEAKA